MSESGGLHPRAGGKRIYFPVFMFVFVIFSVLCLRFYFRYTTVFSWPYFLSVIISSLPPRLLRLLETHTHTRLCYGNLVALSGGGGGGIGQPLYS